MSAGRPSLPDHFAGLTDDPGPAGETPHDDLWFLPGPMEPGPSLSGAKPASSETTSPAEWIAAEAGLAARLAHVAGRLGALDDRLRRGPDGWRHRLALIEAAELGWRSGNRIAADRLALWISLRLAGVQEDPAALARMGWAVRRLTGGPGPEAGLLPFLDRKPPQDEAATPAGGLSDRLADRVAGGPGDSLASRAAGWLDLMAAARGLHPVSRACMGYHFWGLAGLAGAGDGIEAAVTAARIAAGGSGLGPVGAVFAPRAMGGPDGLRGGGAPPVRLARWLDETERATRTAMRHLDDIEVWAARAETAMRPLSGRTPPALRAVLTEWSLVSAPMAERLTGASRAAVQRNLAWMERQGLIREVTGQGRFRMWRAAQP